MGQTIKRATRWAAASFVLMALLIFVPMQPAAAEDLDDFSFVSLDADYTLTRSEDGTSQLRVVETFVADFPGIDQNRGMRRLIPTRYNGQPLNIELVSVTDENGNPRDIETDTDDGVWALTTREDDYVHGQNTYVITYDVENVTWNFPDTGLEFYWNVNGVDWLQPFGTVTARLHVDAQIADAMTGDMDCAVGAFGATDACEITTAASGDGGATITASTTNLAPNETMSFAVGFEPETFTVFDTSYLASGWGWAQGIAGVGLLGAVGGAVAVRRRSLRDEPGDGLVIAQYEPPKGIDALESAVLLGKPNTAIPAEVLEQAIVGSLRIVTDDSGRKSTMSAELIDASKADANGVMMLRGMFGKKLKPGSTFEFGKSSERFSGAARKTIALAETDLVTRGLRRDIPTKAISLPLAIGFIAAGFVVVFGIIAITTSVNPIVPGILLGLSILALFIMIVLLWRKPLTAAGSRTIEHLQGLKEFINWAEADRIRMLQSPTGAERTALENTAVDANDPRQMIKLYERLLPYAVVFGQEKQWAEHLMVFYERVDVVPTWYFGTAAFSASSFTSSIGSLSTAATTSSTSAGGSAGGASAGGGGGGGGGGGA